MHLNHFIDVIFQFGFELDIESKTATIDIFIKFKKLPQLEISSS